MDLKAQNLSPEGVEKENKIAVVLITTFLIQVM